MQKVGNSGANPIEIFILIEGSPYVLGLLSMNFDVHIGNIEYNSRGELRGSMDPVTG